MSKDNKAEILDIIKREGPLIPSQLSKIINTNILFASAILSNLVDKKEVLITSIKRGGSPFYYLKGQEGKLESLSQYLSGKPKEAFDLLKEKGIIRDKIALPWQRVALREIKDFAVPLTVTVSGEGEIFWKFYSLGNDETKNLIKEELGISNKEEDKPEEKEEIKEEIKELPNKEVKKEIKEEEKILEKKEVIPIKNEDESIFDVSNKYFSENEIYVISQDVVRKNKEFNFVVDIPTNLGKLRYFVKSKSKKIINDKDIENSWNEGSEKKLPVLFLTDGELTKKAEKYLNDNVSGSFVFKKF